MKQTLYLVILCFATSAISCKKESTSSNNSIEYKLLNLSATMSSGTGYISAKIQDVPITGEIGDKVDVVLEKNASIATPYLRLSIEPTSTQEFGYFTTTTSSSKLLKAFAKDAVIDASTSWYSSPLYGYAEGSFLSPIAEADGNIQPGSGDKYVGMRLKLSDNSTHYGWMLINYSADKSTVTVKEVAYNKNENEAIKAGQK